MKHTYNTQLKISVLRYIDDVLLFGTIKDGESLRNRGTELLRKWDKLIQRKAWNYKRVRPRAEVIKETKDELIR